MLNFKKLYHLLMISLIIGLLISCEKDEIKTSEIQEDHALSRIKELGFDLNDVVEYSDYYVVEDDITFLKQEPEPKLIDDSTSTLKHARTNSLAFNGTVRIFLNTNFPTLNNQIRVALDEAITAYNNLNSAITLQRVTNASQAHITVLMDNDIRWDPRCSCEREVCGRGGFPFSNGSPFNSVRISEKTLTRNGLTNHDQLVFLLAHELGHNIGLRHTDWNIDQPRIPGDDRENANPDGAIQVPNTPDNDANSVMNKSTCGFWWSGFSTFDVVAINNLYPNFTWTTQSTVGKSVPFNSDLATRIIADGRREIWYANSIGTICYTYQWGSSWGSSNFPNFPKARLGSGFVFNSNNTEFYYIATNNTICRIFHNGSSWTYEYTAGTGAASNSDISLRIIADGRREIWYANSIGTICYTYQWGSSWGSSNFPNFPKARLGSGFVFNNNNTEFYYIATNNTICRIFHNGSSWTYEYTAGTGAASNSDISLRIIADGRREIWYANVSGAVCYTYQWGSGWSHSSLPNWPRIKSGSKNAFDNSRTEFYYIGTDNKIYRGYVDDQNWSYVSITRRTNEYATFKMSYMDNCIHYTNNGTIYEIELNR